MRLFLVLKALFIFSFLHSSYCTEKEIDPPSAPMVQETASSNEWLFLKENKRVGACLISLLENQSSIETNQTINQLPALGLFEERGTYDRFNRKTSDVRPLIEKQIINDIESSLKDKPKDTPVRILVMHPSGYLEEAFILGHLLKQGKTNIELTCIGKNSNQKSIEGFQELQAALVEEGVSLKITTLATLNDLPNKTPFHVGYFFVPNEDELTFDTIDETISAKKLIAAKGHFFFSQQDGTVALSPHAGAQIIEMTKGAQIVSDTIISTQLNPNRAKDRTRKIVVDCPNASFLAGPFFYSISELLQKGLTDLSIAIYKLPHDDNKLTKIISDWFDCLNGLNGTSPITFQWKKINYVGDKIQFRKDLYILWYDFDIKDQVQAINRSIILTGSSLPEDGHWIIYAKDLGLWVVDGKKNITAIAVPSDKRQLASVMIKDLFSDGSPWYK